MATTHPHRWYNLSFHRPWEDWLSFLLGLAALVAPLAFVPALTPTALTAISFIAVAIMVLAMLERVGWSRWEEIAEMLCGLALMVMPWLSGYGGGLATAHLVLGGGVLALGLLEFWQDRNRA